MLFWLNALITTLSFFMLSSSFSSIKKTIDVLEKETDFQSATFAMYAVSEKTGKILLDYQGEKSLLPNSIIKVITTASALKGLKEDFSYTTRLVIHGDIQAGVLNGDLLIIGGGDPTLGSDRFEGYQVLEKWVGWIKNEGIAEIKGDIIADCSFFEKTLAPSSWLDEDVGNYYGAGACGLNFHDNAYAITFKLGSKVGDPALISHLEPVVDGLHHINHVIMGQEGTGDRAVVFGGEYVKIQTIRGTLPLGGSTYTIRASIPNPAEFCAQQLKNTLEKKGVVVKGKVQVQMDPYSVKNPSRVNLHKSPLLSEIIDATNKASINLYAESLLKTLGYVAKGEGSLVKGLEVVDSYLENLGVDTQGWHLVDGSGLSSQNRMTAKGFVDFLLKIRQESYFPRLFHSLVSNKEDRASTFKYLLVDPILQGKLFIKTGYSSQGQSIGGFLINSLGDRIAFCIICNRFLGSFEKLQTKVKEILYKLESAE